MNPLLELDLHPVIGHRGASGLAPENTIASFELAMGQGAEALELDVRLSADGVPVVIHDPTLDRTTDQAGPVAGLALQDIHSADAGHRFTENGTAWPWRGRGVRVPTLQEVVERFPEVPLLIELKVVEAALPVRALLLDANARERVVVGSFLEPALIPLREFGFSTSGSREAIRRMLLASLIGSTGWSRDPVYAVPDRYRDWLPIATRGFIRTAQRAGAPVHVWTVNGPERAEALWRRGANGLITNYPGVMRQLRDRLFPKERAAG